MQFGFVREILEVNSIPYNNLRFLENDSVSLIDWEQLKSTGCEVVVFKSHDVSVVELLPFDADVRPLFIKRDLRDAFLSAREKWNWQVEMIPQMIEECQKSTDYFQGLDSGLLQHYETAYANKTTAILEIAHFLNLGVTESQAVQIAGEEPKLSTTKRAAFNLIKRMVYIRQRLPIPKTGLEKATGRKLFRAAITKMIEPDSQLHPDHMSKRKGAPGGWESGLTEEEKAVFANHGF